MGLPNASETTDYNLSCSLDISLYILSRQNSETAYFIIGVGSILLSIVAVLGNTVIFFALRNCSSLHSASKSIFYSLALSDFLIGVLVQPLFVAYSLAISCGSPAMFCTVGLFFSLLGSFLALVSFWTMMVAAMDRYFALQLRFRYREIVKTKLVVFLLITGWIVALLCTSSRIVSVIFRQILSNVVFFCCLLNTSYFYIKAYLNLRQHTTQILGQNAFLLSHYRSSLTSMVIVFCVLLATYMPFICALAIVVIFGYNSLTLLAFDVTSFIGLLNSSLNPLIYCWRIREIRMETLRIIRNIRVHFRSRYPCKLKPSQVYPL